MHPAAWFTALLKDCHPLNFPTTTVWAACFAMFREPCLHFVGRFLQYTESRSAKSATVRSLANPLFPAFNSEQSCRQCNRTYSKTGQSRGHGSYQGTGQICPNPCGLCLSSSSLSRLRHKHLTVYCDTDFFKSTSFLYLTCVSPYETWKSCTGPVGRWQRRRTRTHVGRLGRARGDHLQ